MRDEILEKNAKFEEIIKNMQEKIEKISKKGEDFENQLKEMNKQMKDISISEILQKMPDNNETNPIIMKMISANEKKMEDITKMLKERTHKVEEENFKLTKEIENIKIVIENNAQKIKNLKEAIENNIHYPSSKNINSNSRIEKNKEQDTELSIFKTDREKQKKDNNSSYASEDNENQKDSLSKNVIKTEKSIDLENNDKIKELVRRITINERTVKSFPNAMGIEQIKSDISALKSNMANCVSIQDLKEVKEREDDIQRQVSLLKEHLEDLLANTNDHDDLQEVKRRLEVFNSKIHELETNQQDYIVKSKQTSHIKSHVSNPDKFLEINKFEEFKSQMVKEFKAINDNFINLRRLVDNILEALKNKPSYRDIKALEDEFNLKYEDIKVGAFKKFAEKIEMSKNFKFIEQQIKNISQIVLKRENKADNWLIAKMPLNSNLCASCEAYIGDLKDNNAFPPWNKYPAYNSNDKNYKLGSGFSKMLQFEDDKKNQGKNQEFNLTGKLIRIEKQNIKNNISQIKTESNFFKEKNINKGLPKINSNYITENKSIDDAYNTLSSNYNKQENLEDFMYDNEGMDKDNLDNPKVTKIRKINKE